MVHIITFSKILLFIKILIYIYTEIVALIYKQFQMIHIITNNISKVSKTYRNPFSLLLQSSYAILIFLKKLRLVFSQFLDVKDEYF